MNNKEFGDQLVAISDIYPKRGKFGKGTPAYNATKAFEPILKSHPLVQEGMPVEASPGRGNWTDNPWIAIYFKDITEKASHGFYLVYLLSENQDIAYFSLACSIEDKESQAYLDWLKAQEINLPGFEIGPMPKGSLNRKASSRGRGYELASLYFKKYVITSDMAYDFVADFECAICYEIMVEPRKLSCGHRFCSVCLRNTKWNNSNCPMCRCPIVK